jgi:hemerythrin superfamily protein
MTADVKPGDVNVGDVVDLLLAQHGRVEELFREVLESTGDERRDTFHELTRLLAVHETAEEEIVHPLARRSIDGGEGIVDDRLTEEREAKELLADLYDKGPDAPDFEARLLELRQAVLTHARFEERYEFTRLREAASQATLKAAAAALVAAEATAPTRPHPGTESATKNLLVGPPAAIMDRARDVIRDAFKKSGD